MKIELSDSRLLRLTPILNLPRMEILLQNDGDAMRIYDNLRHKWVALTPEEWVRQNFSQWLVKYKGYPCGRIANEVSLAFNRMVRRCDTVVYGSDMSPLVIVEYKAPDVSLSQKTFDQVVRYNMVLCARYLIVTNGMRHYCCSIDYATRSYRFLQVIPDYVEL